MYQRQLNQSSAKALMRQSLLEHVRMVERAQQAQQDGFLASIHSLMSVLEARDPYTRGHSERVRAWVIRVCRLLRLADSEIENISLAARLHDIGKVGVRDEILGKAGPLSTEEWKIMRKHPVIGVDILSHIQTLQPILTTIRGHHERWDGKGYPDGIQGDSIPLGARVIAVADAYDALVTDRPYRKGFSRERAREVLQMGSGTQWGANVVEALVSIQARPNIRTLQTDEPKKMAQDPVCGMFVIPGIAQAQASFENRTFYFCSTACRELFDKQPMEFRNGG